LLNLFFLCIALQPATGISFYLITCYAFFFFSVVSLRSQTSDVDISFDIFFCIFSIRFSRYDVDCFISH